MNKNTKRIISAGLIAGLVCPCFGDINSKALATVETEKLSVFENFDEVAVNTTFVNGSGSVVADPADEENRVWKIENTTSGKTTLMTNLRPSTFLTDIPEDKTGKLTYEYKVYIPADNPKDGSGYYPIVNNLKQYEGMNIGNVRPNTVFRSDYKKNAAIENGFDNWFLVEYVFDYSTMTFDAYAEGKQFEDDTSFKDGLPSNKQYFDPIEGLHLRAYVPSGFKYYIDDLKVTYSDEEDKIEINQLITGIDVKGVKIDNFTKETKSYEIELSEDDYNSLTKDDILVSVVSEHSDVVPEITVGNDENGIKTITIKAEKEEYSESFTVLCKREEKEVLLPSEENNKFITEDFSDDLADFITGNGIISENPVNASDKALKIENTGSGMTTLMTNIKPLSKMAIPETKLGKLIYEYDVLFPGTNPLDKGGYYSAGVQIKQYEGMGIGTFRPINAFYNSKNIIGINAGPDKWYRIRYIFDYNTETFDAYAEGKLIADDISYRENLPANKKFYDPAEGLHLRAYVPAGFTYYIDNVTVGYVEVTPDFVTGIKTYDGEEYNEVLDFSEDNYSYTAGVYAEYFSSLNEFSDLVKPEFKEGYEDAEVEIGVGAEKDGVKPVFVIVTKAPYIKVYTINYSAKLRPYFSGTLEENFNGKTAGNLESFITRTGGGTTEIIADDETHGDVLKVIEAETANNYYVNIDASSMKPNGEENAKLIYEFDFKIDDKFKTLPLENKGETTPVSVKLGSTTVAHLRWFQIGVGSTAYKFNDAAEPSEYTWESIKIEIDCDTKEFKYYFDGNVAPVITAVNDNVSFDNLFKLQLQWWNGTKNLADVYIDNVKASYVVSHPEMVDNITVAGVELADFDNKNYIYNIDLYEDLYNTLTEDDINVLTDLEYADTVIEKSITETEDMKVIDITLTNGLYVVNYKVNCFSELRPATLSVFDCESSEYSISFDGYIEDELGNPVSRDITVLAYKKGEEPIGSDTCYFGVATSEESGELSGDILVFDDESEPTFYEMEVMLDAYGIDVPVVKEVLYVNNSQLEESVKWLKASDEDVLTYITTADEENAVTKEQNIEIFKRMNIWTEEYTENPAMQDKMEEIADSYKENLTVSNIASFVNGAVMAVILSDENVTEEKALELVKEYDSNIENIVVSEESFGDLSETEQKWVIKNLLSRCKDFENAKDLIEEIRTSMLLCLINNAAYTELEELILDNEDLLGKENIKDLKNQTSTKIKDKAMKTLVTSASKKDFTTADGFIGALADALSDAKNSKTESEGSSGGTSGGSSGGKKNPVALGGMDITTPVVSTPVFSDLDGYNWAEASILKLNEKGIVSGVGNGRFEPARTINREEFAKLLCETFGYEKTEDVSFFEDVEAGSWYEGYVMSANKQGVINGISDTLFGRGMNITRQDMVTMMYRALKAKGIEISGEGVEFKDSEEISDYAKDAVAVMTANGIVNGVGDNLFAPKASATRAEAAVIISRVMDTFLD